MWEGTVMSPPIWAEANREFFAAGVWRTVLDDRGRRICKYPTDLEVYREVIREAKPEVIVETGSAEGGSASWFADLGVEVISIDLISPALPDGRVHWVTGDSTADEVIQRVTDFVGGRRCLVSLDSDHRAAHVAAELAAYAELVPKGSYLIVEDTAVDVYGLEPELYPEGGPLIAVRRFLAAGSEFVQEKRCERFMLGMNPGGWLRRVA